MCAWILQHLCLFHSVLSEDEGMRTSTGHFRVLTHINCSEIFIEISDLIKHLKEQQQLWAPKHYPLSLSLSRMLFISPSSSHTHMHVWLTQEILWCICFIVRIFRKVFDVFTHASEITWERHTLGDGTFDINKKAGGCSVMISDSVSVSLRKHHVQ